MNRRDFLKSLLALGAGTVLPTRVTEAAISTDLTSAWKAARSNPFMFYINEWGALSTNAVEAYPATRMELLGLDSVLTREDLLNLASDKWDVQYLIEIAYQDALSERDEDDEPDPWNGNWEKWFDQADDRTVNCLIEEANTWLEAAPDGEDYEVATIRGYSDRGQALSYFRDTFEFCDDFNVVIVEGDCPGSSYFAAELRMDIDEANQLAEAMDLPIRFAEQG